MAQQLVGVPNVEKRMDQPAVANVHLGRLDQALPHVGAKRRQAADQQQIDHQVQVASDGLSVHAEVAGQLRGVPQAALGVGDHRPEAPQRDRRHARPQLGNVPLQVGAKEVLPPQAARAPVRGEKGSWEAASDPQAHRVCRPDFADVQRRELHMSDPPRQALSGLTKQLHRRRAQDQELARGLALPDPLVDDSPERWEDLGKAVDFVGVPRHNCKVGTARKGSG